MTDLPVLPDAAWLAFTADHDEDDAARIFQQRHQLRTWAEQMDDEAGQILEA